MSNGRLTPASHLNAETLTWMQVRSNPENPETWLAVLETFAKDLTVVAIWRVVVPDGDFLLALCGRTAIVDGLNVKQTRWLSANIENKLTPRNRDTRNRRGYKNRTGKDSDGNPSDIWCRDSRGAALRSRKGMANYANAQGKHKCLPVLPSNFEDVSPH